MSVTGKLPPAETIEWWALDAMADLCPPGAEKHRAAQLALRLRARQRIGGSRRRVLSDLATEASMNDDVYTLRRVLPQLLALDADGGRRKRSTPVDAADVLSGRAPLHHAAAGEATARMVEVLLHTYPESARAYSYYSVTRYTKRFKFLAVQIWMYKIHLQSTRTLLNAP